MCTRCVLSHISSAVIVAKGMANAEIICIFTWDEVTQLIKNFRPLSGWFEWTCVNNYYLPYLGI